MTAGRARSGEMFAMVGHEMRRPLTSIKGYTEMLLAHWEDFSDADKIGMLKEMRHDAERVGRLIDDLVEVSRLETGRASLVLRQVDMADLVARVVADLKAAYPVLEASVEIPPQLPPVVADPFRLEQVIGNILENACQYGSPGTVRIRGSYHPSPFPNRAPGVSGGPLPGTGQPPAGEWGDGPTGQQAPSGVVEIAISDKGEGIAPDDLPHVTEKFYRSAAARRGGLGLGLWISKSIVEAHGGRLVASSVAGEGATVHFTIPLRRDGGSGKLAGP